MMQMIWVKINPMPLVTTAKPIVTNIMMIAPPIPVTADKLPVRPAGGRGAVLAPGR